MAQEGGPAQVNIGAMPLEQLNMLREQLQEENKFLSASYQQLTIATRGFQESRGALKYIAPENVGTPIMVPITSSLYVKGVLADADNVLVDVGTGYYVEKTIPTADDYLKRKVDYLVENCSRLEANIVEKRKNLEAVTTVMQMKFMQQQQQQKAAGAKA